MNGGGRGDSGSLVWASEEPRGPLKFLGILSQAYTDTSGLTTGTIVPSYMVYRVVEEALQG
jgi:hypothetical protein